MESTSRAMRKLIDAASLEEAIEVRDVVKTYPLGAAEVVAIDHLSLTIAHGEFAAIVGRSGSGKTTLLNLLAGIDRPTSGTVRVAGADLGTLSESGLAAWRGENVGLVFQFFQLLPTLTVPDVGWSRPPSRFRSVVLPLPDRPRTARSCPGRVSRLTPRSAWMTLSPEG